MPDRASVCRAAIRAALLGVGAAGLAGRPWSRHGFPVVVALANVLLTACVGFGPKPVVTHVEVHRGEPGRPAYRIDVTVENQGLGQGEAVVLAKVIDPRLNITVAEDTKTVELLPGETEIVRFEFAIPYREDYQVRVEARYPP